MKMMVSQIDCSSLFSPCRSFARLNLSPTPVCSASSCLSSLVFTLTELAAVASACPICSRRPNMFRDTLASSSSHSLSSALCLRFSHIWPHHPSCFALTHRCRSLTELAPTKLSTHCDPVEAPCHREPPVVLSAPFPQSFSTFSELPLFHAWSTPGRVPLTFCATPQGLSWRLVRLSAFWWRRGHLQSQKVSKVPGRLWLLVASFALQLLHSPFPCASSAARHS